MSVTRETIKHASIYSFANLVSRLVGFLLLPLYAYQLQPEGYGVLAMLDAAVGVLVIAFASGFQVAIVRTYHDEGTEERKATVVSTAVRLMWLLSIILVVPVMLISNPISRLLFGRSEYYYLVILSLLGLVFEVTGKSASSILFIKQRSLLISMIALIMLAFGISLNILFVVVLQWGVLGVLLASLGSSIVSSTVFHVLAARAVGGRWDPPVAAKLLRFQLPLIPGDVVTFISRQAERVLVRCLIGLPSVGVLEMAYKFPPLLNFLIASPFGAAWRTKSMEIATQEGAPRIIGRMFTNVMLLMAGAGILMASTIAEVLKLMTPSDFWGAARIARIEVATTILAAAGTYMQFGLLFRGRTAELSRVRFVLAPIKIAISLLLISSFGLSGAAYSALVMEAVALVWVGRQSQMVYKIPIEYGKLALAAIFSFVASAGLNSWNVTDGALGSAAQRFIVSALGSVIGAIGLAHWKSGRLLSILETDGSTVTSLLAKAILGVACTALLLGVRPEAYRLVFGRRRSAAGEETDSSTPAVEPE